MICQETNLICISDREFLPLACFDDRDLKKAQREHKFSYQEFINGKAHSEYTQSNPERTFGQGKRAQPLKILIRNSDPKADTILDLLVRETVYCLSFPSF